MINVHVVVVSVIQLPFKGSGFFLRAVEELVVNMQIVVPDVLLDLTEAHVHKIFNPFAKFLKPVTTLTAPVGVFWC